MKIKSFQDLIGMNVRFGSLLGKVAEYDSWDTYLVTFPGGYACYFNVEQILSWAVEDGFKIKDNITPPNISKPKKEFIVSKFEA
jgi:hypothetical protein